MKTPLPALPKAKCVDYPADWWFSPSGSKELQYARRICRGCPEMFRCREWAVEHQERGVWGGVGYGVSVDQEATEEAADTTDQGAARSDIEETVSDLDCCRNCGRGDRNLRRKLCTACYGRAHRAGDFDNPPPSHFDGHRERVEKYKDLAQRGLRTDEIASLLGVNANTVNKYAREVRRAATTAA